MRIVSILILLIATILFPLPLALGLFVVLVSFFSKFWEGVLAGIVLDSFYFSPLLFFKLHLGFFTVSFILVIFLMERIKHLIEGRNVISKILVAVSGAVSFYILFLLFY